MRKRGPRNGAAGCAAPTPLNHSGWSVLCTGKPPAENGLMICPACRAAHHEECPGGNWCDCQHKPPRKPPEPPLACGVVPSSRVLMTSLPGYLQRDAARGNISCEACGCRGCTGVTGYA